MKNIVFRKFLFFLLFCMLTGIEMHAQNYVIQPVMMECDMSDYAQTKLEARLTGILDFYGISSTNNNSRIVIVSKIYITSNNIMRTNPPRVSKHMELVMTIGDIIDNYQFSTCRINLAGIGENDAKAYISAFNSVNADNPTIQEMIATAKQKINTYYSDNIDNIVKKAKMLSLNSGGEEALYMLTTIPNVNETVMKKRDNTSCEILKHITAEASYTAFVNAKAQWTAEKGVESAKKALGYLKEVNASSPNYKEALALWKEIANKLESDEKEAAALVMREYEDSKKQYEDRMAFRQSILDACVSIGTSFGNHQPQTVSKTINKWGF